MKLPKTIYVAVENKGQGEDEYLGADAKIEALAEDEERTVGIYRLERLVKVWKQVETKPLNP